MTNDRFFRGFLAALREVGTVSIVTRDDAHHKNFQAVVRLLDELDEQQQDALPTFVSSPFTGRFRELDDALLQMQHGLLRGRNPFFFGMPLDFSKELAKAILEQFSSVEQDMFRRLAKAYNEDGTGVVAAEMAHG